MKKYFLLSLVLCIFLWLFITLFDSPNKMSLFGNRQTKGIIYEYNKASQKNYELKKDISKSENMIKKEELRLSRANSRNSTKYLDNLKTKLCFNEVEGEGVILTLFETGDYNTADSIEKGRFFLRLINELKENNLHNISINGQRITFLTDIVLAGNHLNINKVAVAPPYEIKILGEPNTLESRLILSKSLNDIENILQFNAQISKSKKIKINAFNGSISVKYMELD